MTTNRIVRRKLRDAAEHLSAANAALDGINRHVGKSKELLRAEEYIRKASKLLVPALTQLTVAVESEDF